VPALAAALALAVGVLAGWLLFDGEDPDSATPLEGGAADAAAGCQLLGGLPEEIDLEDDRWRIEGPWVWRLEAASAAFSAAARADDAYAGLEDDAAMMRRGYQQFEIGAASEALDDLRDECADLAAVDRDDDG
jgi:hypothetical protein